MGLALSSCAVQIHDEAFYLDEGESGATEVHFLSAGQTDLSKKDWDAIRFGMVCESQSAFGDFKKEIEELCTKARCSYELKESLDLVLSRLQNLKAKK